MGGTHYVGSARLGGAGHMTTAVNADFSSASSDSQIAAEASVHFAFLQAGGSGGSSSQDADASFTSSSFFQTVTTGGDPRLGLTDWSAWIKTFYSSPALIQYNLLPLHELMPESDQKENYKMMVNQYREVKGATQIVMLGFNSSDTNMHNA